MYEKSIIRRYKIFKEDNECLESVYIETLPHEFLRKIWGKNLHYNTKQKFTYFLGRENLKFDCE